MTKTRCPVKRPNPPKRAEIPMFTVENVLNKHYPRLANRRFIGASLAFVLRHLLHEKELKEFADNFPHYHDIDFVEQVLDYFNISYSVRNSEKSRIPASGTAIIVANHPIGSLDALALIKLISEVRSDVKVVANQMLMEISSLHGILLPVNNMQGGTAKQHLHAIQAHIASNGIVLIFPAGEVSRLRPQGVRDTRWHSGFLRLAKQAKAPIIPVFIDAKNSPLFYGISMIYKPLATALLVKEMFKQRKKHLPMRVGEAIPYSSYEGLALPIKEQVKLFKKHLYKIAVGKKAIFQTQAPIALPEHRQELKKAIHKCERLGTTVDNKLIYLYQHQGSSPIMREIGRLRELAFRAVGEGTFTKRDIDAYDSHYFHLILWDPEDLEIAGAYRFGDAETLSASDHPTGLYSATLFDYGKGHEALFKYGLELGRSFVQPQYWGKRSLDYLWYGIGAFLSRYPKYKYLFGAVSISNTYPKPAKDVLVAFYKSHFPSSFCEASAKLPYLTEPKALQTFSGQNYKEEFAMLKNLLANMGVTVPTLYKQYSETYTEGGVSFLDFNVDPLFSDCIDALVVGDLSKLDAKRRKRYMPNNP